MKSKKFKKIKNFLIYNKKKIKKNFFCNNCNYCISICPINKINFKKKINCNLCNLCELNCNLFSINFKL